MSNAAGRSLPLESFAPLAATTEGSLLSLQKGPGSEQLASCSFKERFVSCQAQINETWDFLETAAIIANCDLVITSDSAVAHLAGGMGHPVWLLLKKVPDWRWGLEGDTSFWYPCMRLFRQSERGNWDEVIQRVVAAVNDRFPQSHQQTPSDRSIAKAEREPAQASEAQKALMAQSLMQQGQLHAAEAIYRLLLAAGTTSPSVLGNLAAICGMQGNYEETIELIQQLLRINPNDAGAHNILGGALKEQGNLDAAIDAYRSATRIKPDFAEAHQNLGICCTAKGDYHAAIAAYQASIAINPNHGNAHLQLGHACKEIGDPAAAIASYNRVIELEPDHPDAHLNLGLCHYEQGEIESALLAFNALRKGNPSKPESYYNLAIIQSELGSADEAIALYNTALELKPDYPDAIWNRSLAELATGDYNRGWKGYEWRPPLTHAAPPCRRWDGSPLDAGDQLVLVSEQGQGDTLQFMRYLPVLRSRGMRVSLCAPPNLHPLIQSSGVDDAPLTPEQANQLMRGYWLPLLSVPQHLGVSPDSPIISEPYIHTTKELIETWQGLLAAEPRPIIAIHWQGNPTHEQRNAIGRSLPLEAFAPLAASTQATLLSLQKGPGSEQLASCSFKERFVSCQVQINETWDFLETAAIIANCDLVITSDSAVAHLAGGMGHPVWLLLKKVPDWRWGLEGDTSFWYPSMRLFRQSERGNWDGVIQRVVAALNDRITRATRQDPANPREQEAEALIQQGRLQEAEAIYRALIAEGTQSATVYGNLAAICAMQGRTDDLIGLLNTAIQLNPNNPEAHNNLGNLLQQQGDLDAAITAYSQAIQLKPEYSEAHSNLSLALRALQRTGQSTAEVEATLRRLIAAGIRSPSVYGNLAAICGTQGRFDEAQALIQRLIDLNPNDPGAYNILGSALKAAGNLSAAIAAYSRALQLRPDFPEAYSNLYLAHMQQGDLASALDTCRRALEATADPFSRQGSLQEQIKVLLLLGREQEAEALVASQRESWQRNLLRLCLLPPLYRDGDHIKAVRRRYQRALRQLITLLEGPQRQPAWQPALEQYGLSATSFYLAYQMEDDRSLQQLGCRLLRAIFSPRLAPFMGPLPASRRSDVLRLGVASHHLHDHNGANWSLGWLEPLAADPRFRLFTYQLEGESDSFTERFAALGQHRRLSVNLPSIASCAQQIRDDDLDVLLYPAIGMDPYTRVLSLLRLAPLQATAWGHPVTSGSEAIDWFFTGEGMEPSRGQRHYSETLVQLPHTGLNVPAPSVELLPGDRDAAALELPPERPLLFSAQTSFKYDPRHDSLLVEIARANPEALILLVDTPPQLAGLAQRLLQRLEGTFSQAGLQLDQHLRLLPRLNQREFIQLFRQVTLALDTPAWNGGNTSLQAFSQGCPVVTIPGRFMRGRHTLAMLQRMDIPELIARDATQAIAIVSRLLADPHATSQLRQRILQQQHLLFCDTATSDAFRDQLLHHWQQGPT